MFDLEAYLAEGKRKTEKALARRWEEFLARDTVKRLMFTDVNVRQPPYSRRYPELADLGTRADLNSVWRNVFVNAEEPTFRKPKGTDTWDNLTAAAARL